ncbi:MAG: purine-nucleoside phosphorylase [Saprospiraceae bacterium]|nr:purine-nucleoside phosphorylase [Saprospiraceae bacterium]
MEHLFDKVQETVAFLHAYTQSFQPQAGIILGTGLGNLTDSIEITHEIPYSEIPHFPVSTVEGHAGRLVFGRLAGKNIVAMAGRFHYYEGYSMQQVTFPIRVLKYLGIQQLFISNAAGSVNAHMNVGDIVFIRDHINLQPENPLRGKNDERFGLRFPDLLNLYNKKLNNKALQLAKELGIPAHIGVYVATQGPNLETPAEYRFFNIIGGDVVGMSTVPEVLVAKHMQLPVWVASVVSNKCFPIEEIAETTVEEVINAVAQTEPKLSKILTHLLESL